MAKPNALNYRGNTGNTGYGFVQVLGQAGNELLINNRNEQPNQEVQLGFHNHNPNEPNMYHFKVEGNLKYQKRI